jgi:hypothetical protein
MKGLILKDFINLKKNVKTFGVLTLLYAVMAIYSSDTGFFSSIFTMLLAILTLSLYSYDEMAKWDPFAMTMPISKDDIVQGKYIMMLLLTLIGSVYSSVFTAILNIINKSDSLFLGFENIGIGAAIVILFYSITMPFITKLGVEKARLIFFAIYIVPFIIIMTLNNMIKSGKLVISEQVAGMAETFIKYVHLLVPLLLLIALGLSYWISVNIYRKKEF